jgi:hypothetical protein
MAVFEVQKIGDVETLITQLLSKTRREPICVVSVPVGASKPLFDMEQIISETGDVCDSWILRTGELSRQFAQRLPEKTETYGGSARVYPPGTEWTLNPALTKMNFIFNDRQIAKATEHLISDIHAMAFLEGLYEKKLTTATKTIGTVVSLLAGGTRAMVKLASGEIATISQEFTYPDVPLEWVIKEGMELSGFQDREQGRFQLDLDNVKPADLLTWYPDGGVTWALVQDVDRQRATLAIHPRLSLVMEKSAMSSNPKDRVDLFLALGDIVPVRIFKNPQGNVALRMIDIDDDEEILDSQPLITDGLPWLTEDRAMWMGEEELNVESVEDFLAAVGLSIEEDLEPLAEELDLSTPQTSTVVPRPGPGLAIVTSPIPKQQPHFEISGVSIASLKPAVALSQANLTITALQAKVVGLQSQLKEEKTQVALDRLYEQRYQIKDIYEQRNRYREQYTQAREQLKEAKAELKITRAGQPTGPLYGVNRSRFFNNPAGANEWVLHEIKLAWIERLGPQERLSYPLPKKIELGPEFSSSIETLDNGQKNKAFKAVVDVLTSYGLELDARNIHPLREGDGASSKDVIRSDGAICLRAYIEHKTASARRLHYWQKRDGSIELSRVVLHDDMNP